MSWTKRILGLMGLGILVGGGLLATGHVSWPDRLAGHGAASKVARPELAPPIAVSVVQAHPAPFAASVLVTGSLVAREEVLVGPEIEGFRIVEVLADEGDRVAKGQVLARLVSDTLDAQLAQNVAALARADAAIAQARSAIASAEARLDEAANAYERAKPLSKSGFLSDSGMDQREATRRTAEAAAASARDGLKVAEAEKAQIEAQRRELVWRRARTDIRAPAEGLVSRRNARIGGYATGSAEPMFRIIAKGEIELDAEVPETRLFEVREGQTAIVEAGTSRPLTGVVRLVSPEVDRTTRLGRLRISLGAIANLHVGAFARARIWTATSHGIALPASAVLHSSDGPVVQVVVDGRIATRPVRLGLAQGNQIEIRSGLGSGETVVARAGTFLRDGDAVRAIPVDGRRISESG